MRSFTLSRGLLLALTLAACGGCDAIPSTTANAQDHGDHGHGDGHDGGHGDHGEEEEGKTAVITVWADRFEAFIEHDYLVKGRKTKFITHISDLETGEPRRQGSITFVMTPPGGGEAVRHVCEKVARDGIYLPLIAFPKTGRWAVTIEVPLGDEVFTVKLPDRDVYADDAAVRAAPDPEEIEGISYLKEQQWKLGTLGEPVERRTVIERLPVSALVEPTPDGQASVRAAVAGVMMPATDGAPLPQPGDTVKAGQVLARVRPPLTASELLQVVSNRLAARSTKVEVEAARTNLKALFADVDVRSAEAKARVTAASARIPLAEANFTRVETLFKAKAKSKRQLEEARFALVEARTEKAVAESLVARLGEVRQSLQRLIDETGGAAGELPTEVELPTFAVKAPIAGVVAARPVRLGENVTAGAALFEIINPAEVHVRVRVPEAELGRLSESRAGEFLLPGRPRVRHSLLVKGESAFVYEDQSIDPHTRTLAHVYRRKRGELRPGMRLSAFLETRRAVEALAIPVEAIVDEAGQAVVFVHISGETYERRDITTGAGDGRYVEVQSGLKAGERVVVRGAYNIRLASLSNTLPAHGHAH